MTRRLLEITNQEDVSVSFKFNSEAFETVSRGGLKIEPVSGALGPGETRLVVFEYTAGRRPEIFSAEVYLHVSQAADDAIEILEEASNNGDEIIAMDPGPTQPRCSFF